MRKPHSVNEANISRDSFSKALYDRLFTWIVGHVNSVIDPSLTESANHQNSTVIGVLDIYGFEVCAKYRISDGVVTRGILKKLRCLLPGV